MGKSWFLGTWKGYTVGVQYSNEYGWIERMAPRADSIDGIHWISNEYEWIGVWISLKW